MKLALSSGFEGNEERGKRIDSDCGNRMKEKEKERQLSS